MLVEKSSFSKRPTPENSLPECPVSIFVLFPAPSFKSVSPIHHCQHTAAYLSERKERQAASLPWRAIAGTSATHVGVVTTPLSLFEHQVLIFGPY